jgi:serine/threonine-protein phosphatase 2A activator
MLDTMDSWLDEFPPLENAQRFGNKAFRSWGEELNEVGIIPIDRTWRRSALLK